jgi:hypothetical protein
LTKTQTKEQKINTIFFSISISFFFSSIKTTQTINFHSRDFLKSKKKSKTQQTQKQKIEKKSKSNRRIHNRNECFSTEQTQQKDKQHTRISFSSFLQIQILKSFLNLLFLKTKQMKRTRRNK